MPAVHGVLRTIPQVIAPAGDPFPPSDTADDGPCFGGAQFGNLPPTERCREVNATADGATGGRETGHVPKPEADVGHAGPVFRGGRLGVRPRARPVVRRGRRRSSTHEPIDREKGMELRLQEENQRLERMVAKRDRELELEREKRRKAAKRVGDALKKGRTEGSGGTMWCIRHGATAPQKGRMQEVLARSVVGQRVPARSTDRPACHSGEGGRGFQVRSTPPAANWRARWRGCRTSCIPSFCKHQITPKTSRYTRCSMSMFPNVSINGRIRSSGQLGRWW